MSGSRLIERLVEGLRELGAEKIALNSVYYWPDWRDGIARFLKQAGFDLLYCGNFVDLGIYDTQEAVNEQVWIFPGEMAQESMLRVAELAPAAPEKPRQMIFDGPFLLILREKGDKKAKEPYLAVWIENTEVLEPFTKTELEP